MTMTLKEKLNHAVKEYDRKQYKKSLQSKRGYYNEYALGIYLGRVDDCCQVIEAGADIRKTLEDNFNDRLLDCVLKAAGL